MNRRAHETLDDTIDRVAAAMTLVPPDGLVAAHVTARLGRRPALLMSPVMVATGAVAVVVLAIVLKPAFTRQTPAARDVAQRVDKTVAVPMPAPILPAASNQPQPTEPIAASTAPTAAAPAAQAVERGRELPAIAALTGPADLAMADLEVRPLTVAPVDVEALDVVGLIVPELSGSSEPKE
jgi:hypothetical protein